MDLTVATVLKSGGEYTPDHVYRLRDQCEGFDFVCLSDVHLDCQYIQLKEDWSGWWSKIELFRPNLFKNNVIYLDLDSTVTGDLNELIRDDFTMLSDFYKPHLPASGVMAWYGDACPSVYEVFRRNPKGHMAACRTPNRWGDQGFIAQYAHDIHRFDDNLVVSYKKHCQEYIPSGSVVVAYHGRPKPWDIEK